MLSKRQAFFGAIAVMLVTFFLTVSAFMYGLNFFSGDAMQTLKFFRVLHVVKSKYVEDIPLPKLMDGAIEGLIKKTNDPHSIYMQGDLLKVFMSETEGHFGGIGVIVGVKEDIITVVAPVEGTPGETAGIKSGDKIVKINGEETKNMSLDVAVGKIRGPKDTPVTLDLVTFDGEEKTIEIIRSDIKLKTVYGRKLDDNIGYIRMTMFNEQTADDFAKQLEEFDKENITKIVLDLRNNPGGLLDSCVKVAQKIIPKGPIVSIVSRDGQPDVHYSDLKEAKYKFTVLVNGGSASASEIIAGALQDTKVGIIVGTTTYGKGSVQSIMPLDGSSAIKLTFAKYYTPAGHAINGIGVKPDLVVELSETNDNQLEKAIEILKAE